MLQGIVQEKVGQVTFLQAIKDFFKGFIDFKGRTTRAGYWWIAVFGMVADMFYQSVLLQMVGIALLSQFSFAILLKAFVNTGCIIYVLFLLPRMAMTIRRWRDAGLKPWAGILTYVVVKVICMLILSSSYSLGFGYLIIGFIIMPLLQIILYIPVIFGTDTLRVSPEANGLAKFYFYTKEDVDSIVGKTEDKESQETSDDTTEHIENEESKEGE